MLDSNDLAPIIIQQGYKEIMHRNDIPDRFLEQKEPADQRITEMNAVTGTAKGTDF